MSEEKDNAMLSHPNQREEPKWVKEMHAYRKANGHYHPEDLQRVLGDQRVTVGPKADAAPSFDYCKKK